MRQFSERFFSCRTQQKYTQVGIRIFRFFRIETGVLWYAVPASKMEGPCPDKFGLVQQIYLLAFLLQQKAGAGENPLSRPFCAMRGPSALHLALHEVAHHLVQLAHGVLGTFGDLAGGAAHLALTGVGGHDAGSTQCGPGGRSGAGQWSLCVRFS